MQGDSKPKGDDLTAMVGNALFHKISFCIVATGTRPMMVEGLVSVLKSFKVKEYEILVGGIHSSDDPSIHYIPMEDEAYSFQWNAIRNALARHASHNIICFLNEDVTPEPRFYEVILGFYEQFEFLNFPLLNPDGTRYWDWCNRNGDGFDQLIDYDKDSVSPTISSPCFLTKKRYIVEHPFHDGPYELSWEVEYSRAVQDKGAQIRICRDTKVFGKDFRFSQTEHFTRYIFDPEREEILAPGISIKGNFETMPSGVYPLSSRAQVCIDTEILNGVESVALTFEPLHPALYDEWPLLVELSVSDIFSTSIIFKEEGESKEVLVPLLPHTASVISIVSRSKASPLIVGLFNERSAPSVLLSSFELRDEAVESYKQISLSKETRLDTTTLHVISPFFTLTPVSQWSRQLVTSLDENKFSVWIDSEGTSIEYGETLFSQSQSLASWHRLSTSVENHGPLLAFFGSDQLPDARYVERLKYSWHFYSPLVFFPVLETLRPPPGFKEFLKPADEVWVISEEQKSRAVAWGADQSRCKIVPLGVNTSLFDRDKVEAFELGGATRCTFLCDVSLEAASGWDLAVRAYLSTFTAKDNVLLIVKTHTLASQWEVTNKRIESFARAIGFDLETSAPLVVIDGSLTDPLVPSLYAACHYLIASYRNELFPLSLLQAMSMGMPLLLADHPTYRQLFEGPWSIFIRNEGGSPSIEDLQNHLRQAYENFSSIEERRSSLRAHTVKNFSLTSTISWITSRFSLSESPYWKDFFIPPLERLPEKAESIAIPSTNQVDDNSTQIEMSSEENFSPSYGQGDSSLQSSFSTATYEQSNYSIASHLSPLETPLNRTTTNDETLIVETDLPIHSLRSLGQSITRQVEPVIGIDIRCLTYIELTDRGIGHYTQRHLSAIFTLFPQYHYRLILDQEDVSPSIESLLSHSCCSLGRMNNPHPYYAVYHVPDHMSIIYGYDPALLLAPSSHTMTVTFYDLLPLVLRKQYLDSWTARLSRAYLGRLAQLERHSAHILSISDTTKEDLLKLTRIPEERISTIYGGAAVSREDLDTTQDDELLTEFPTDKPFFLVVGALDPHKNFERTLEAFMLTKAHEKIALVVVGSFDDPYKELFRSACETHFIYDVSFVGFIPHSALCALYRKAIALIFISLHEGLGLPVIEAMALGCPVITSNSSSLKEFSGDAAMLVDPTDAKTVARAMMTLLKDSTTRALLISKGKVRAREFTWEQTAHRTMDIWHNYSPLPSLVSDPMVVSA
jgi:glycosyltransferase involved in cell wall biosynthesis